MAYYAPQMSYRQGPRQSLPAPQWESPDETGRKGESTVILIIHAMFSECRPLGLLCVRLLFVTAILPAAGQTTGPSQPVQADLPAGGSSVMSVPAVSAAVQAISLNPRPAASEAPNSRKAKYEITVTGGDWQGTGIQLMAGDQVKFQAAGTMALSDSQNATPAGATRGWKDLLRLYPLSSANSGALLGRIGSQEAALPFLIGESDTLTAPADGELYLRANLSPDLTADGSYNVTVALHAAKAGSVDVSPAESQIFASRLSPELFDAIPRRVSDQAGSPGDMVNFALVGTEQQVQADLSKAGWFPTDANPQDALMHGLLETLAHKSYMAVPMSTLFLFGRPQDMAYARANAIEVAATRNHLRLWKTTEAIDGLPLWVGSATHDHGFETDQRTGGVTHHIDPDIDQERDFILASFNNVGAAKAAAYVRPSNPISSARTATGGSFNTDGRIVVVLLR